MPAQLTVLVQHCWKLVQPPAALMHLVVQAQLLQVQMQPPQLFVIQAQQRMKLAQQPAVAVQLPVPAQQCWKLV